jgi:ABC-type Fe3+-hydroxamate transport system substrate-binding protein
MLVVDALGRQIELRKRPERVVSLVPSLTEMLFDLGVRPIAVTDYCLHPAKDIAALPRVGGQKDPDLEKLLALSPDFVVVAKEENLRRDVEKLEKAGVSVFVTDVKNIDDALRLPFQLGAALGVTRALSRAAHDWMEAGVKAARRAAPKPPLKGICFVWRDPWIAAGGDTYLSDVLAACGVNNMMTERSRYPKLTLDEAQHLRPDVIVLPSEPYPFSARDLPSVPRGVLVDGTVLCWYGPRTGRIAELATIMAACATSTPSPP